MNLKERLAKAKQELAELKAKVEAGDADATKRATDLLADIDDLEAQIKAADEKAALLDRIGKAGAVKENPVIVVKERGTLGRKAAEACKAGGYTKEDRFSVSAERGLKAASDNHTDPTGDYRAQITETRPEILAGARRPLTVADLFSLETTEAAAVTYYVEGAVEGGPTAIAEGGAYSQLHVAEPTPTTDALKKIGTYWKDTDELLADATRLAQSIDNRADYLMDIVEEDQLLSGDGAGNNIKGLLNRSGLQTLTSKAANQEAAFVDAILKIKNSKVKIRKATPGFRADALLINDEDWDVLTSVQDANKQFLAGGPFNFGPYGNGAVQEEPPLWGLRVVPTQAITAGTMVIGAFKLGGSVIRKGGRAIEVTNSDGTDFTKGLITMRTSERLALAVRYPAAFVKLTVSVSG